jgi:hypothetical protein
MSMNEAVWVPEACTLPTVERPLRLAEFDDLFATALLGQLRVSRTRLRWQLDPAVQERARDLTARESSCCSFFTFSFTTTGDGLQVDVEVPAGQVAVLDALTQRAVARIRA